MKQYKFSVEDIKKFAKSMVILVDSREKKNSHIIDYFKKQGISYKSEKLDYGDYSKKSQFRRIVRQFSTETAAVWNRIFESEKWQL